MCTSVTSAGGQVPEEGVALREGDDCAIVFVAAVISDSHGLTGTKPGQD
jgi:hypothetical protein